METRVLTMVGIDKHFGSYFDVFGQSWLFLDEERIMEDEIGGKTYRVIGYTIWDFSGNAKQVVIERTSITDKIEAAVAFGQYIIDELAKEGTKLTDFSPCAIAKDIADIADFDYTSTVELEEELESYVIVLQNDEASKTLPAKFDFTHFLGEEYSAELTEYGTYLITSRKVCAAYKVEEVVNFVKQELWRIK